jgi:uncharacterized protein with ATP-grasp and redox domains
MKKLINLDWSKTPPELAHIIHRIIRVETGERDPYKRVKKESNDQALQLLPKMKDYIKESPDPLETAVRISIAGNIMDFGPFTKFNVDETVRNIMNRIFAINNYHLLNEKIRDAKNLLFFTDNTGEIVFDKLLIDTIIKSKIIKTNRLKVTVVVKGGSIINDATIEDAKYIGMDRIPNIEFKTISNGDPNTGPERNSEEVESWIYNNDITIAKGQGNYEGMHQFKRIFFMLMVKCQIIASDLKVNEGDIILHYSTDSQNKKFI